MNFYMEFFYKKKSILKHVGNIKLGPINKIHKSAEDFLYYWK